LEGLFASFACVLPDLPFFRRPARARRSASTRSTARLATASGTTRSTRVTGEEVSVDDIIKGYQVGKGQHIEIADEELEAIALESTRTIEIDGFVPRNEIDELYNVRPYYIAPNGKVGQDEGDQSHGCTKAQRRRERGEEAPCVEPKSPQQENNAQARQKSEESRLAQRGGDYVETD
jgi:hypothetical protein